MKPRIVEPEVAGGLGPRSVIERSSGRPVVLRLHHVFDGWLGDELLESTPCFLMTRSLLDRCIAAGLRGVVSGAVEVSVSDQFRELHPDRVLPEFVWAHVDGKPAADDFWSLDDGRLAMSDRAWRIIGPFARHADVTES